MNRTHLLAYAAFSHLAEWRHPLRGETLEQRTLANWEAAPAHTGDAILIYCATLGEFRAINPLVRALQQWRPKLHPVYILGDPQYSPTLHQESPKATILLPPGPLITRVRDLFHRHRPALVIYAEGPSLHGRFPISLDLSIACQCLETRTPLVVANACLYEQSLPSRIDRLEHSLFRHLHRQAIVHWYCGHEVFADELIKLGVPADRVSVTGDLKFDAAQQLLAPPSSVTTREYAEMIRKDVIPTLVAGCVNEVDELEMVVNAWETICANGANCRLIVAPRYLNNAEAMQKLFAHTDSRGLKPVLRSQSLDTPTLAPFTFLDTFGELSYVYQAATVAYAGRNHGVLEPLVAGVPTVVSPDNMWRKDNSSYPLYQALAEEGVLWQLGEEEPLANAFTELLLNTDTRANYQHRIAATLAVSRGAGEGIVADLIERKLI